MVRSMCSNEFMFKVQISVKTKPQKCGSSAGYCAPLPPTECPAKRSSEETRRELLELISSSVSNANSSSRQKFERRGNSHGRALLALIAGVLASAATGSHRRGFERQTEAQNLKERPLASYNNLDGASSSYHRSTRSLGHTVPRAQEGRESTPPESQRNPGSPEEAEREGAVRSPETSSSQVQVNPKDPSDEGRNSSRVEPNAIGTEYESVREAKFVGKIKDWYRGRDKDKDKERDIVVIATGAGTHGYYVPHHHPVVVTHSLAQYVTVTHPAPATQATPSVVVQTSHVTYVTPSVVTSYVTSSVVTTYVTQSHVPTYVTSITTTYITHSLTPTYVMSSVVTAFVTQTYAPTYVTSFSTTYVTQTHAPTYVTPSVVTAFVTHTNSPTQVTLSYTPTYVTPSHVFIQEPHPAPSITAIKPQENPTITHTIVIQGEKPIMKTHIKGTYSGQGHFELFKSTLNLDAEKFKEKLPGCTHCG
ncbi:uncharacterized protein LOC125035783 [Penaeus chinensis]|uniref:uncharacterized protein LOC125035783 n=1 Tax=Penaeus chinensis TaxID=139456 RepID=UPI001FB64104|nr:uncharacterized protein LOC125035783 [Penaeus chinensis]